MSTHSPGDTSAPVPPDLTPRARRRRRFPGPWCLAVVALALVTLVLLRTRTLGAALELAAVNVATLVLACVAAGAIFVWFSFFSAYSRPWRWGLSGACVLAVIAAIACLRIDDVDGDLVPRRVSFRWQPQADQQLARLAAEAAAVDLQTTTADDFPQFLGPRRDARLTGIRLRRDWPAQTPRLVWRREIGAGWSSFAVVNGFAVTMEQRGDEELVTCYELATGTPRWVHSVPARHQTVAGGVGPRATPTIHEGRVYALGATGVLRCLDGATGQLVWSDDLLARIGVTPEEDLDAIAWGRANSPLIVDNLVVVPLGGPVHGPWVSLAAFDKTTGRLVWTGGDCQASYSSPVLATLAGERQILIVNQGYVSGHDPASGHQLWKHPWPGFSNSNATVSQVVPVPNDRLLLSKGYGIGAKLLQISRSEQDDWQVAEVWSNRRVLQTKFCNVVVQGDYVYGLSDGILECVDLASGQRVWKGGRYAQGQILGIGDLLLVQAESGDVAMVEATPAGHRELGRFAALEDKTWNNPSLYGRYLLVRNAQQAACYELALEP